MKFLTSLLTAATTLSTLATAQLNLLYQFPAQPYINIENIAVRSTNGQLLLTTVTGPTLYQFNPDSAGAAPEPLITLPGPVDSMIGIAELYQDVYIVSAGNFSFGPQVPGGVEGIPGTFSVWSIDLTGASAVATQIVAIPEASSLNGVTRLESYGQKWQGYSKDAKNTVLIADSGLGAVWSVNVQTGAYASVISSPLFANSAEIRLGINGVHTQGSELYWTNSAQASYGKVAINADGTAAGDVQVIANAVGGSFDDFALLAGGAAFVATQPNAVSYVDASGGVVVIAGGGNDTTLLGPTSAALKGSTLYVTTGGLGAPPPAGQSGQIFGLDVSGYLSGYGRLAKKWIA